MPPVSSPPVAGPSLREIGWLVARDVNRTIGGGMASMELMRRALVRARWLDDDGHAVLVAVSRFTPGTNLLAYCAALGWTFQGLPGALVTAAAGSLPGAIAITAMAAAVDLVDRFAAVRVALAVAMVAASGLVLSGAWSLAGPYVRGPRVLWTLVSVAISAALYLLGLTPIRVLLVLAMWGAVTPPREPA